MAKYLIFAFCLIFSGPLLVQAQVSAGGFIQNASIVLEPNNPEPYSTFSASINDYALPSQTTSVSWKINGIVVTSNNNLRNIKVESGKLENLLPLRPFSDLMLIKSLTLSKPLRRFI